MIGVWVCGHKEVEEDGRDAGVMRDTPSRVPLAAVRKCRECIGLRPSAPLDRRTASVSCLV